MKKLFIFILVCICFAFSSCAVMGKNLRTMATYKDPETIGGTWTVTSQGKTYEHLKCTYWGTNDDTAIFKDSTGHAYVFSGTMSAVQE